MHDPHRERGKMPRLRCGHDSHRSPSAGRAGNDDAHELAGRIDGGKLSAFVRNAAASFRLPPPPPPSLDRLPVSQPDGFVGRKLHAGQIFDGPQRRLEKREPVVASQLAGVDGLPKCEAADRGPLQAPTSRPPCPATRPDRGPASGRTCRRRSRSPKPARDTRYALTSIR